MKHIEHTSFDDERVMAPLAIARALVSKTLACYRKVVEPVIRTYIPMECPICGGIPFDGSPNMFCATCFRQLSFLRDPVCPKCGGELNGITAVCADCLENRKRPWNRGFAPFAMDGLVREVIHKYKYRQQPELITALGTLAGRYLTQQKIELDAIVPTPLHWTRLMTRGFNQAELLAKALGKETGLPVVPALTRIRRTKQQAKLDKMGRIQNLSDAFAVFDSTKVEKRAILLVDDVMTTGATLTEATKVLRKAGAREVNVLVIARRQRI